MAVIPEAAAGMLARVRLGFVATVSRSGAPNVSPKGTIRALDAGRLVFADIRSPDTVANIAHNPAVEISAIDPISRRGYLFEGAARLARRGAELDDIVDMYRRDGVRSSIRAAVIVDVARVSEVTSPLYDLGMSEAEVSDASRRRYLRS